MPARNFTDEEEAEIAKIYLSGVSAREIARRYGLSHHISITAALGRQGVKQRSPAARNRLYKVNGHVFDDLDQEQAAYWYGFIYADGHVQKRSLIVMLSEKDKDHLESLRGFMESEHPISVIDMIYQGGQSNASRLCMTDRHLAKRLKNLGILPWRPRFDLVLENLPTSMYNHWIRGYFDGDGGVHERTAISFVGQQELLEWVNDTVSEAIGVKAGNRKVTKHRTAEIYNFRFGGRKIGNAVADYMYKDATVWIPRKLSAIKSWPVPEPRAKDALGRYT